MPRHVLRPFARKPKSPKTPAICRSLMGEGRLPLEPSGPSVSPPTVPGPVSFPLGAFGTAAMAWNGVDYQGALTPVPPYPAPFALWTCFGAAGSMTLWLSGGGTAHQQPTVSYDPNTRIYTYKSDGTLVAPGLLMTVGPIP